jgi:nucleoside-diphosphate-sugar epimerase
LTGATGFLGGAIAANLADKGLLGDTRFAISGITVAEALTRLRTNLSRFQLPQSALDGITEAQIEPFDLRNAAETELGDPDITINCAALATFSDHPSLWQTNVD